MSIVKYKIENNKKIELENKWLLITLQFAIM